MVDFSSVLTVGYAEMSEPTLEMVEEQIRIVDERIENLTLINDFNRAYATFLEFGIDIPDDLMIKATILAMSGVKLF